MSTTPDATPAPNAPTVVAVNLAGDQVGGGWGRSRVVAIAGVADGRVTSWVEHAVGWDVAHDAGAEGSHHARIVRFIREHGVEVVVTGHLGASMANTLSKLGCRLALGATGDARSAAVAGATASPVDDPLQPGPQRTTFPLVNRG